MKQLYEIRTFRPIRRPGLPFINKPTRMRLEMDEVKEYMAYGPVYRIFENSMRSPERVTGNNIKELHGIEDNIILEDTKELPKNLQEEELDTTTNSSSEDNSTPIIDKNSVFQNPTQWNNKGKNNSYNQYKNNKNNKPD